MEQWGAAPFLFVVEKTADGKPTGEGDGEGESTKKRTPRLGATDSGMLQDLTAMV